MHMKKFFGYNLSSLFVVIALTSIIVITQSCSDENDAFSGEVVLSVGETDLNFESGESDSEIHVDCNVAYQFKLSDGLSSWCEVSRNESGNLHVYVSENEEKNVRRGAIYIQAQSLSDTITIAQLGWGKAILLSAQTINVDETGGTFNLDVTTNVECSIDYDADWIKEIPNATTKAHEVVTTKYSFEAYANKGDERIATIMIHDKEIDSEIEPVTLTVIQKKMGDYLPEAPETGQDIQIKANAVTGNGGEATDGDYRYEKMIDGVTATGTNDCWQAPWTSGTQFPQYIEFTFNEPQDLDYVVYHASYFGHFKDIEIQAYTDVNETKSLGYHIIYTGTLVKSSGMVRIDFKESQVGISRLKFVIKSSYDTVLRCCEMEFYKKDPSSFDYNTLFANQVCTELKTGITESEILSCQHSFFKKIAWYMYNDKYPREFRIADFKAYPHPDEQAKENKTTPYSLLDNPTGISVSANENLVVMADLNGRESVNIRVQNLDKPGGDGFGGNEYVVRNGINILPMKEKGLVYVMYHTTDFETAPKLTLHFASGSVNGYFDSQNPTHQNRWHELLSASVDKYFDVLGKYAHLTFPTKNFRNNTKDGKALIDWYDQLVYREQEFMGLKKYGGMFKNRMYFNVMYTSYMYATSYHTSYNESTIDALTDETMLNQNCWGQAHEVGHCNQTRPGLKWLGTTEVTNNIMSLYIQTTICGSPSRLEANKYYDTAWNAIIVPNNPHATGGGTTGDDLFFCKLVPFWQLELYFGKVLGLTPIYQSDHGGFYADVYEYMRKNPDLPTPGEQQLEFVYLCCKVANMNLLDFFEKWGFLTPVETEIDDYGKAFFSLTSEQIDILKQRVNNLNLPYPKVALEYITDSTIECYKDELEVVKGSVVCNGNVVTLSGWKNVVAFEVKNMDGELIYISSPATASSNSSIVITIPAYEQNEFIIEAVSAMGIRVPIKMS